MSNGNYANSAELREIALVVDDLQTLAQRLETRGGTVSIDIVELFDTNGDSLGFAVFEDGTYVFRAENPRDV